MGIARAKAPQHDAPLIGLAVAIRVFEKKQFGALTNVNSSVAQFDARRNKKALSEDGGFVGLAITIGVFEDNDLVVRHLARLDLRIDRAADHPEAAARIKPHLNRLDDSVQFRSEEVRGKSVENAERGQFGGRVVGVGRNRPQSAGQTRECQGTQRELVGDSE